MKELLETNHIIKLNFMFSSIDNNEVIEIVKSMKFRRFFEFHPESINKIILLKKM